MHISMNTIGNLPLSLAIGSLIQETQTNTDGALYRYKLANTFESPVLWNNVSLCFSSKKKYVAAISCLKRSLYLNTFDWKTNYNLGLLNLQLKQYSSAFHYLKGRQKGWLKREKIKKTHRFNPFRQILNKFQRQFFFFKRT